MACAVSPVHLAVRIERHGHGCEPSADSGRAGTSAAAPVARVLAEYCPYWFESVSGAPIGHRRLARVSTLQRTRIQQAKERDAMTKVAQAVMAVVHVQAPAQVDPHAIEAEEVRALRPPAPPERVISPIRTGSAGTTPAPQGPVTTIRPLRRDRLSGVIHE